MNKPVRKQEIFPSNLKVDVHTTYADTKGRIWVVLDLDYFGEHSTAQELPQTVLLYQVNTHQIRQRVSFGEFLYYLENKLFIKK